MGSIEGRTVIGGDAVKWTDEAHNFLIELKMQGLPWKKIAKKMTEKFNKDFNPEQCRSRWRTNRHKIEIPDYKETIEIGADGSHKSDRLLRMNTEQSKDVDYLLAAHGYDKEHWELVSARNNIWNSYSKQDGIMTMFASKITVKPRVIGFNFDKLLDSIKNIKPVKINKSPFNDTDERLLEIATVDQHFGVNDFTHYEPTQQRIHNQITSRVWEEIIFLIGNDMLHHNDHRNRTASGTEIQHVDINQAWEDARKFFEPLIELSIKEANKVKVVYVKGNHDETLSWAFVQMLKARYPQVTFDDAFQERKVHTFEKIFIGWTHGDKSRKDLHNIFPVEFPTEWANAKTREIHTGHFHKEDGKDVFGTMVRTLATKNKTDQWHKDNGYVGAHKRFMLFEYCTEELRAIHYV